MTCYTALITPFKEKKLDEEGLRQLIHRQQIAGIYGLALLGTTAETPTLTLHEKKRILQIARKEAGELSLLVGIGSNDTQTTLDNASRAVDDGADALLVIAPYYNRPTQEGIYLHFSALANASPLPIIIYNHPGRTGINIEPETLERLAMLPQISGIKETSDNLSQISNEIFKIKEMRPDFLVYTGNDHMTLPLMSLGGDGVISVVSNIAPLWMNQLVQTCRKGDYHLARKIYASLLPLFELSCVESNPIPVKAALEGMGLPSGDPRLPLTPLSKQWACKLHQILEQFPFYNEERSNELVSL